MNYSKKYSRNDGQCDSAEVEYWRQNASCENATSKHTWRWNADTHKMSGLMETGSSFERLWQTCHGWWCQLCWHVKIYLDCQDLGYALMRISNAKACCTWVLCANSCNRGLPWNQLSFILRTITLNYSYMIIVQKKAIDGFPIPFNKGFHAVAEAQTN